MLPAQPPLPTAWYLLFQFSAGSHSSISMCESAEGVNVSATRQNAGSTGGTGVAPRPAGAGVGAGAAAGAAAARYGPAAMDSAEVIVASASFRELNFSQGV